MFRKSDDLSNNYTYARFGIESVYEKYPYGGLNRSDAVDWINKEILCVQLALIIKFRDAAKLGNEIEMLQALNKLEGGFCGELAHLAKFEINKKFPNAKVEFVRVENHEFLVIGRKEKSNPMDYSTWGDDAVFCDPWAKKIYRVSQFLNVRKDSPDIEFFEIDERNKFREIENHYLLGEPKILSDKQDDFPVKILGMRNKK